MLVFWREAEGGRGRLQHTTTREARSGKTVGFAGSIKVGITHNTLIVFN